MATLLKQPPSSCDIDSDFYDWTQQQASLIRQRRWSEVDVENLAEEVEDLE